MFKHILVTGGAGYVGSRLVPQLLREGYHVRVLDWFLFHESVFDYLTPHHPLELVRGDIRDQDVVRQSLEGIDAVIHLAAISNDPSSELDPQLTREVNYEAVKTLAQLAREKGVKRFINPSSAAVYGIQKEANVTEDLPPAPLTFYAEQKARSEAYLLEMNADNFTVVSVRPATLCGYAPRQRLDLIVNILTHHAIAKGEIIVYGGEQIRPNLHIQDMVDAYCMLLRADSGKIGGEIFNLGRQNHSVLDLAHITKEVLGTDAGIQIVPTLDPRSYHISSQKIQQLLGFTPQYGVVDAVRDLQQAFQQNLIPHSFHPRYYNVLYMRRKRII